MSKTDTFDDLDTDFGAREAGYKKPQRSRFGIALSGKKVGTHVDTDAKLIELDRITSKEQLRTHFDEEALAELTHSVSLHGVQQSILVYWSEADEKYVVIAGERRFRAAKAAGNQRSIPCRIHAGEPDEKTRAELQFIENDARADFNAIEQALSYQRLMKLFGFTTTQLGERLGKNQSTISRALCLLKLPQDIVEKIAKGKIPKSIAELLLQIPDDSDKREFAGRYLAGGLTTAEAKEEIKARKSGGRRRTTKQQKKWTIDGIAISVTYGRGATLLDVAEVLEQKAAQLREDGRSRRNAA